MMVEEAAAADRCRCCHRLPARNDCRSRHLRPLTQRECATIVSTGCNQCNDPTREDAASIRACHQTSFLIQFNSMKVTVDGDEAREMGGR